MKRLLFILLLCVAFVSPKARADNYQLDSLGIKDDLSLLLYGVDFSGCRYNIGLDVYSNPSDDPAGLYWKLGEVEATLVTKNVMNQTDIPYVTVNPDPSGRQKLDIYYPEGATNTKVVIFVPGGAWATGDKSGYSELADTLVRYYGFTVVVINYRLSSDDAGSAVHPDHVNDVASAFAWVKSNISQYGGDPGKVFLFGQSAGAHLASLLATNSKYLPKGYSFSDIAGVIAMSGAYELEDLMKYPNNPLGLDENEVLMYKKIVFYAFGTYNNETVLNDGSPQEHITTSIPPFLVLFAEDDMPGFPGEALNFVDAIRDLLPNEPQRAEIRFVSRADISEQAWSVAADMASRQEVMSDYVGHYAEVTTINQNEYNGRITRLIAEFVNSH